MSEKINYFTELANINVNEHVEKKGKFSYLSWAYAVDVLRKADPAAKWEVIRFNGMPFMTTPLGYFVEVAVTVQDITLSQIHPVLDNNNRPIAQPTSFQINTSIQRCLVKAIALHGLGLYIYAGEDLPDTGEPADEQQKDPTPPPMQQEFRGQQQQTNTPVPQQNRSSTSPGPQGLISEAQMKYCYRMKNEKHIDEDDFRRMISEIGGRESIRELTKKEASEFINLLNNYQKGA
ncbi:DUF1071 domain-containing protein [Paenibacillus sp. P32E]|uniref:Sak single strand annealing protein n=1 Tax=Paenibacillus sp. P32E TaxID=1349434 RepID=UPI0009FAD2FC|nr:DUF1071 domain-containing protein [Paenibacillus sp. P32E]